MSGEGRYECVEGTPLWRRNAVLLKISFDHNQQVAGRIVGSIRVPDVLPLPSLRHRAINGHVIVIRDVRPRGLLPAVGEGVLSLREKLQCGELGFDRSVGDRTRSSVMNGKAHGYMPPHWQHRSSGSPISPRDEADAVRYDRDAWRLPARCRDSETHHDQRGKMPYPYHLVRAVQAARTGSLPRCFIAFSMNPPPSTRSPA